MKNWEEQKSLTNTIAKLKLSILVVCSAQSYKF